MMYHLLKYYSFYAIVVLVFVLLHTEFVCGQNGTCDRYQVGDNLWKPNCTNDNYWRPVQCKGERPNGRCFCYDSGGSRLFGWEWWASAENMTCACSRRRQALEIEGRTDVSLHCSTEGNYEELQCDNGLCWCVERTTGKPTQRAYPESMMTYLPCYNETLVGSQYLRQCESQMVARARILKKLLTHGRQYAHINAVNCEADGSYGHYRILGSQVYCTWKDNVQILTYQAELRSILSINCNCARDYAWYEDQGVPFDLICHGSGNYQAEQYLNGYPFCVDSDGFAITLLGTLGQDLECV